MPIVTLKFNLPEEREECDNAMQAGKYSGFLWDVENEVFRPARKHGYPDTAINNLINILDDLVEKHAAEDHPKDQFGGQLNATALIALLESMYFKLKDQNEISSS